MDKRIVDALISDSKYYIYAVLYEWLLSRSDGTYKADVLAELASATSLSRDQVQKKLMTLQRMGLVYKTPAFNAWFVHRDLPADVAPLMVALACSEAWIDKERIYLASEEVTYASQVQVRSAQACKHVSAVAIREAEGNTKAAGIAMQGIYSIELLNNSSCLDNTPMHSNSTIPVLVSVMSRPFPDTSRIDTTICTDTNKELSTNSSSTLCKELVSIHSTSSTVEQIPLIPATSIVDEWFKHWQTALNRPESRPTIKRKMLMKKALAAGITREQGLAAIDYVAGNPFFSGDNERGGDYTDITTIFRTPERVEQYARQLKVARPVNQKTVNQQLKPGQPQKGRTF